MRWQSITNCKIIGLLRRKIVFVFFIIFLAGQPIKDTSLIGSIWHLHSNLMKKRYTTRMTKLKFSDIIYLFWLSIN
jgi:hypothetical protein